jgi:hypothetical protein
MRIPQYPVEPGDIKTIVIASSSPIALKMKARLQIQVGGITINDWFFVVPDLSHNILVGVNFMRKYRMNLLHDCGMVSIQNVRIPYVPSNRYLSMAILKRQVCIPPRSERNILIKASSGKKQIPSQLAPLVHSIPGVQFQGTLREHSGGLRAVSCNRLSDSASQKFPGGVCG